MIVTNIPNADPIELYSRFTVLAIFYIFVTHKNVFSAFSILWVKSTIYMLVEFMQIGAATAFR